MVVISLRTLSPLVALIAGGVILFMPKTLNYVVALYLIFIGLLGIVGHSQTHAPIRGDPVTASSERNTPRKLRLARCLLHEWGRRDG